MAPWSCALSFGDHSVVGYCRGHTVGVGMRFTIVIRVSDMIRVSNRVRVTVTISDRARVRG